MNMTTEPDYGVSCFNPEGVHELVGTEWRHTMNDAQRHELFVKLNKLSVLIAKNANKTEQGKDLTREDWKEAAALFNDCTSLSYP